MPHFQEKNAETAVGILLFLMQSTFKPFVETFKGYLGGFAYQLEEWQNNFNKLILRYNN